MESPSAPWPWPPGSNHSQLCVRECVDVHVWHWCCYTTLRVWVWGVRELWGGVTTFDFDLSPFLWTQCHSHSCSIQQVWRLIFSSELQIRRLGRLWVPGREDFEAPFAQNHWKMIISLLQIKINWNKCLFGSLCYIQRQLNTPVLWDYMSTKNLWS